MFTGYRSCCRNRGHSWVTAQTRSYCVFLAYCYYFGSRKTRHAFFEKGGSCMKKVLSLVLVLLFVVSIFGGLSAVPSAKAVAQEVTYNLGAEPPGIDPGVTIGVPEATVEMQVFDGLTRLDSKNVPQPAIAKSWTISKDGKTYIFTLRDAYWTNGTPVTAYDFEYAWKRVLSPELAAQYATQLYYVYGGEAYNTSIKVGTKYYAQAVDAKGNPLTKKEGGKDVPVAK